MGVGLQIAPNCTRILAEYGLPQEADDHGVSTVVRRRERRLPVSLDSCLLTGDEMAPAPRRTGASRAEAREAPCPGRPQCRGILRPLGWAAGKRAE